eukprot:1158349-Pelagomonas_calceolata.AAC.2
MVPCAEHFLNQQVGCDPPNHKKGADPVLPLHAWPTPSTAPNTKGLSPRGLRPKKSCFPAYLPQRLGAVLKETVQLQI